MLSTTSQTNVTKIGENVYRCDNLTFVYLEFGMAINPDVLKNHDAIIVNASDFLFARAVIRTMRSHESDQVYLKPIFLLNFKEANDALVSELNDGLITSLDQIVSLTSVVKNITERRKQLALQSDTSFESRLITKFIGYMHTRGIQLLSPIADRFSIVGFTYPIVGVNFLNADDWQALDILDLAENENLLTSEFYEKTHLCKNCNSGFLIYREVCPHCQSSDSVVEDLLHHFPCAYMGPLSDFKDDESDELICPKCNKFLKHVGVDYDKPSVIYHCRQCDNTFQDYDVKARCVACGTDQDIELLTSRTIKKFKLTKKALSSATHGLILSAGKQVLVPGTVGNETFDTMVHYDLEKLKFSPTSTFMVAAISMDNLPDLEMRIGQQGKDQLLKELVSLIRAEVNASDYITFSGKYKFLIALNNTPSLEASQKLNIVKQRMITMVKNNFDGFDFSVNTSFEPIGMGDQAKVQAQTVIKGLLS